MKKALSLMLTMCMVLSLFATFVISASADDVLTWEDGQIKDPADSTGRNWKFDNAYGYTFVIDADKKIGGEDNALIETVDEYNACNPNWAISVLLKPAGDLYEVVTVVATPGTAAAGIEKGIAIENGNIVLVAHSSASYSAEDADPAKDFDEDGNYKYFNWQTKLAAMALKAGDKVKVAEDKSSVYVLIPGVDDKEDSETVLVKGSNVALNKTYTNSLLYRQRNVSPWDYDENADIAYPDVDNKELTDGKLPEIVTEGTNLYTAEEWVGLHGQTPDVKECGYAWITLDLGKKVDIYSVASYFGTGVLGGGIGTPSSVEAFVSDDGENWTSVGTATPENSTDTNCEKVEITCETGVSGQYVQFRMVSGGWVFVSEIEVYEAVAGTGSEPEVIVETITVDGDLSDNGWAADKWISVNADNGTFQGGSDSLKNAVSSSFSYKFQMRADETKLYVAAVYDCSIVEVDDSGRGTKFRLWIHNGDEACVAYTHFYDIYMKNGEIVLAAKENFPTAEKVNNASDIENSTLVGAMKEVDGKTYFEMSVDLAEFDGAEGFNYFFNAGHKTVDGENVDNIQMLYPAVPVPEDSKNANFPYTKWYAENDAVCDVEAIKLGVVSGDTDDNLGDAGIYAIASLALVALIGTAVVIKKRA